VPAPGGAATVSSLSTGVRSYGYRSDPGSYSIDASTIASGGRDARSVSLALPASADSSLSLELASDGTARVGVASPGGDVLWRFQAEVRGGRALAVPYPALADPSASRVVVESAQGVRTAAFLPGEGAPLADLHAILAVPAPVEGDFALYRWDLLPGTLVLDFADYGIQDEYLKRLAFFAEKTGFRGRVASDVEIAGLHGWNAHDYPAATLAAFFNTARGSGLALNAAELRFLELLVSRGALIRDARGAITEGSGAVISISRESSPSLRRTFLDHEASHALFFQDPEYRLLSSRLWSGLGAESKRFWIAHLGWRKYDTRDEYLCINEYQAYLVQQPAGSTRAYYEALAERLGEAFGSESHRIEADAPFAIEAAVRDAATLDEYLRGRYGLSAGRFGRARGL